MRLALFGLILAMAACSSEGGGGSGGSTPGVRVPVPQGFPEAPLPLVDHQYVIERVDLPANGSEATALGLDVDEKPFDGIDNQMASFFGLLGALAPSLDMQQVIDAQVNRGELTALVNVRAADLAGEGPVEVWFERGTAVMAPPPCIDENDLVCGQQFTGGGTFTLHGDPPTLVTGGISAGVVNAGPGPLTILLAIFGCAPFPLPLESARVELTGVDEVGWPGADSKVGGAIRAADFDGIIVPALGDGARMQFNSNCEDGGAPPDCNCTPGSPGESMRSIFDKAPSDCTLSNAEIQTVVDGFVTRDIDLDGDGTNDAISIGIGLTGIAGTYQTR